MLKVNFGAMKEQVKQAIIESSVEGHVDLEDLTNNLLNLYIKIKREELRKILIGKCVTDNACEVAIDEILNLHSVNSERYLLVEWLNGNPILDGAIYFDSKDECLEYHKNLPKIKSFDIEHTICRISNAR